MVGSATQKSKQKGATAYLSSIVYFSNSTFSFETFCSLEFALQKKARKSEPSGFFDKLFGGKSKTEPEVRTVKPRKAPIKIEPKVFFSNERTFLAWMHVSVILAGASVAILAISDYDNIAKQLYGLIMLPVAVAFLVYSMYQCECSKNLLQWQL